jgi:hypothetical protein
MNDENKKSIFLDIGIGLVGEHDRSGCSNIKRYSCQFAMDGTAIKGGCEQCQKSSDWICREISNANAKL